MEKKTLGIPSGSLFEPTLMVLKKIGVRVVVNGRSFRAEIIGSSLFSSAIIMRPNDLPLALKSGIVDAIITGYDMLVESRLEKELCIIQELNYSKKSRTAARVVIFGRKEDADDIVDSEGVAVTSEYMNIARMCFKKASVDFSTGSTEIKVADKRFGYRYGIGVVETGKSLDDNGLEIIKTILVSPVVFVTREESVEMKMLGEMLEGSLEAELYQLVKFNADLVKEEEIVKILPALESPTISNLADGAIAIETVVPKKILSDTIVAIKKKGGRKIIIQDIIVSV
jgi:ATP phosphoribosyltransferase